MKQQKSDYAAICFMLLIILSVIATAQNFIKCNNTHSVKTTIVESNNENSQNTKQ